MERTTDDARPLIDVVIVNHDTSLFSELALRSLVASTAAGPDVARLRITIADNHSSDPHLGSRHEAATDLGARFEPTRWPLAKRSLRAEESLNTHGDVMRDFVLDHPDPDLYLFVDCDIDFDTDAVVQTLLGDLLTDAARWAVQARFRSAEVMHGDGASLDIWAGRPLGVSLTEWDWDPASRVRVEGRIQPRCHPGATLVRNTPMLRRVAEEIGFSCAVVMSADEEVAGFYDTLGLASRAMGLAGFEYALSRATVHHFFNASYDDVHVAARERDCRARLARFAVTTASDREPPRGG